MFSAFFFYECLSEIQKENFYRAKIHNNRKGVYTFPRLLQLLCVLIGGSRRGGGVALETHTHGPISVIFKLFSEKSRQIIVFSPPTFLGESWIRHEYSIVIGNLLLCEMAHCSRKVFAVLSFHFGHRNSLSVITFYDNCIGRRSRLYCSSEKPERLSSKLF